VEFLEKYAGASVENDEATQLVDILGFTDASTDIEEMDGPIVDESGFLVIADAVYQLRDGKSTIETLEHAFSYRLRGDTRDIFHSLVSSANLNVSYSAAFDSFEAWLEDLVVREAWLDPPGHP
jgi:hypothetical protein